MCDIDVVIPTYHPDERFLRLLNMLRKQTQPVRKIFIVNTGPDPLAVGKRDVSEIADGYGLIVDQIDQKNFDHGGTRRMAAEKSDAPYLLFMTQDAVPQDEELTKCLLRPLLEDDEALASYARQLPRKGAAPEEAFERSFNYPDRSRTQTAADLETLGFKTFYCPNVCAMYRKSAYDALGGFAKKAIFNEDVYLAEKAIRAGYHICYAAEAQVIHSHGYTCMQQLHRNFDQGVSQAMNREAFADVPQEGEGMRLVRECTRFLLRTGHAARIPYFYVKCAFRLAGYQLGKHYALLPRSVNRMLAMNKTFFGEI